MNFVIFCFLVFFGLVFLITFIETDGKRVNVIEQTRGKIWPKPQVEFLESSSSEEFVLDPRNFKFELNPTSKRCRIIVEAQQRMRKRIFPLKVSTQNNTTGFDSNFLNNIIDKRSVVKALEIVLTSNLDCNCIWPHVNMDEHYEIKVGSPDEPKRMRIIAFSVWGILRGMQSFSQMVYMKRVSDDNNKSSGTPTRILYVIRKSSVMDFPRFSHRGVLLDSSRHYLSKSKILETLDLMEMNKFNVFHWHITDNPSFPFQSRDFPKLSKMGAYTPRHVYSIVDITEIIEAARIRGIRVVPEFDTPGHTQSWGAGQPGLLTKCGTAEPNVTGYGPINPVRDSNYKFLVKFFHEVIRVFPDNYIHIGGDEVDPACWKSNQEILDFMTKHNMSGNFNKLESYYVENLLQIIEGYNKNKTATVWQEVFDNGGNITESTVVQIWKGGDTNAWKATMANVTTAGHRAILSSPWYLDVIKYGIDWHPYYLVDPHNFNFTHKEQQRLVLGGEACMWGEYVNDQNLTPRLWPRASVVGERLWSSRLTTDLKDAERRLQEQECRMSLLGYEVEPANGPGFCEIWK